MACGGGWDRFGIPQTALQWFPIVAGNVALAKRLFSSSGNRGAKADSALPIPNEHHARGELD